MSLDPQRADLGKIEPWLRSVGLAIWAFAGVTHFPPTTWLAPWLSYGVAFVAAGFHARLPRSVAICLLAIQTAAVLLLPWSGLAGFEGLLLSVVVAQAPLILTLRQTVGWTIGQALLLGPV